MVDRAQILEALKSVNDPELGRNIVELGMVPEVEVENGLVRLTLALTTLARPLRERIVEEARQASLALDGVHDVQVNLREMTAQEKERVWARPQPQRGAGGAMKHTGGGRVPKVVRIVGYQGSGKTTLARALARELVRRGHEVAAVKHLSHRPDLPGKDTAVLAEAVSQVGFVSPEGSGIFWKTQLSLQEIIAYLEADFILVEGFKAEKTFPKIVCLRGKPDDRDLFDELALCAVGPADQVEGLAVPVFGRDEVERIADLVEQRFLDADKRG